MSSAAGHDRERRACARPSSPEHVGSHLLEQLAALRLVLSPSSSRCLSAKMALVPVCTPQKRGAPTPGTAALASSPTSPSGFTLTGELSSVAKRIPRARKGSTVQESQQLEMRRQSLVNVVDFLCKYEIYAPKVWEMLQLGQICLDNDGDKPSTNFKTAPKCINKLDRTFKAAWLARRNGGHLTLDMIKACDANDPDFVDDIFKMFVRASGTETLPPQCIDQDVTAKAMEIRYEKVSPAESIGAWAQRCIPKTGARIDWTKAGAYALRFDPAGKLVGIKHRASGHEATVPEDILIDKSFQVSSPTSDKLATLQKGPLKKYLCAAFFEKTLVNGPHFDLLDKKKTEIKDLVAIAEEHVASLRQASQLADDTSAFQLTDHVKCRRQEALQRAREQLSARPAKRQRAFVMQETS